MGKSWNTVVLTPQIHGQYAQDGHYGTGDLEGRIRMSDDLELVKPLIQKSCGAS